MVCPSMEEIIVLGKKRNEKKQRNLPGAHACMAIPYRISATHRGGGLGIAVRDAALDCSHMGWALLFLPVGDGAKVSRGSMRLLLVFPPGERGLEHTACEAIMAVPVRYVPRCALSSNCTRLKKKASTVCSSQTLARSGDALTFLVSGVRAMMAVLPAIGACRRTFCR